MPQARYEQVNVDSTAYYHCVSRCVRRAFLCGKDRYSGKNFDHRKVWIEDRLRLISQVYAMEIYAYAIMSNHFHVVLRVDRALAESWSDDEVVERYGKLFPIAKSAVDALGVRARKRKIAEWRERLWDLSWMMRSMNEWIARRANKEDGCKGRFWEGRFKSQALLDEAAVLTCMAYVDLNPVRAGVSKSLETSTFTSIGARLAHAQEQVEQLQLDDELTTRTTTKKAVRPKAKPSARGKEDVASLVPDGLAPFADQVPVQTREQTSKKRRANEPDESDPTMAIPMQFIDYVELLEWTGRCVRAKGPGGRLRGNAPQLLTTLRLRPEAWLRTMEHHGLRTVGVLGSVEHLEHHAERQGKHWVHGKGWAKQLYAA